MSEGFRVEGDTAISLIYTQYTTVATRVDPMSSATLVGQTGSFQDYNTIRFMNDIQIGLGWGNYFDCRNYHIDFLATYNFQIFWNQNMMRALVDGMTESSATNPHNLNLQGFSVKAQLDF